MNRPIWRSRKEYSLGRIPRYGCDRFRELKRRKKCLGGEIPDFDGMVERGRQDPVRWKDAEGAHDISDW
jgi:hypothetical protein